MLKRTIAVGGLLAALATSACSTADNPTAAPSGVTGATTTAPAPIGELAASSSPAGGRSRDTVPLAAGQQLLPCADAARLAGAEPHVLPAPPASVGRPACFVNPPGSMPQGAFSVTVAYIPDGLSPDSASAQDVTEHGGLIVNTAWGLPDEPTPAESASLVHVDVNGHPGLVTRIAGDWVVAQFTQTAPDGRRESVLVRGNGTPDDLAGLARSLRPGLPADERPGPGASPAATTTTTAPAPPDTSPSTTTRTAPTSP